MKKALFILTLIIVGGLTFSCSTDEYDVTQESSAKKANNKMEAEAMRGIVIDSTTALPASPDLNTEPISTNLEGDNGGGTLNPPKR